MNSKERVKKTLRLEIPDRIPFGEFAIDFDTVERILGHETYVRAKAKSQLAFWEGRRDEVVQSWKEDGGYIFGSSHSIAVGTKYENFMTMVDEFLKVRDY